jgi:predicted metal-binding protein
MDKKVSRLTKAQPAEAVQPDHARLLTPETTDQIGRLAEEFGFQDVRFIRTAQIVTARWVGLKCRYGCAKFNTSWCCPPAAPDLQATRELLDEYEIALLLMVESRNEQFYRNSAKKRRVQIKQWKATVGLERKLFLQGFYKAFGLPADACALCKECSYPGQCKFPNEKRPSLEACSIDVFKTIGGLGDSVELARGVCQSYHSYSMILLT